MCFTYRSTKACHRISPVCHFRSALRFQRVGARRGQLLDIWILIRQAERVWVKRGVSESSQTNRGSSGGEEPKAGFFPLTRWSQVRRAASEDEAEEFAGLTHIAEHYWRPVYHYLRSWGNNPDRAQDLTQAFFEHCLEKKVFSKAKEELGRFRSFLLTALNRFTHNQHRDENAPTRTPKGGFVAADELESEEGPYCVPIDKDNPEAAFHRSCSCELILEAIAALEREYEAFPNARVSLTLFRERIANPVLRLKEPRPVKDLAAELEITENAASQCLIRVRTAFRSLMVRTIRSRVSSEEEVNAEIRDLLTTIATG